ncbi:MAG: Uma2 family endonuclease [Bacteroidia bacterium]|nr:Uma2 family endonuclease [Bacteroidia bacterium]
MKPEVLHHQTYETYLALTAQGTEKYEFHDGMITAMAGGSLEHGQIAMNAGIALGSALLRAGASCILFSSDVKIWIGQTRRSYYPDLSVTCDPPERSEQDPHALTNPVLILEVLSESTEAFDRCSKFNHYRELPSLREYVLLSQSAAQADLYYRTHAGGSAWEISSAEGLASEVHLKSLRIRVPMRELYRLVPGIDI